MGDAYTVTLRNEKSEMRVLNLPHEILGPDFMRRQVVGRLQFEHNEAERGLQKRARGTNARLSKSIRLMGRGRPGAEVEGLPPAVVRCPEVAAALRSGDISATDVPVVEPETPAPETPAKPARPGRSDPPEAVKE